MALTGLILPVAFSGQRIPSGWRLCDGSLLDRTVYSALFAVIGTTFGVGDGSTTFGIPDMILKTAVGVGSGSGLTTYALGDAAGAYVHTLTTTEIPSHQHVMRGSSVAGDSADPTAVSLAGSTIFLGTSDGSNMDASVVSMSGQDQPHDNMPPFTIVRFMIATVDPANMDPKTGEILIAPFTAPTGYLPCDGSAVSRSTYSDLFSAIGVTYGPGNGTTTFNVPDMQGRVPLGAGQGFNQTAALTLRNLADKGGTETITLTEAQTPPHRHLLMATKNSPDTTSPVGALFARTASMYKNAAANVDMAADSLRAAGGGGAHENRMPVVAFYYLIKT